MRRACLVSWTVETDLWNGGCTHVAGIDEVGRGALAGPVVAAAVILPAGLTVPNVDDSKQLTRAQREALFQEILQVARGIGVGYVDARVIDRVNIRQGTLLAMQAAIQHLPCTPGVVLVDGQFPGYGLAQHKGYGTTAHLRAIQQLGPSPIHRVTFRGVAPTASSYA
jgi:ribonuclease HII